jgi:hypothetical protein
VFVSNTRNRWNVQARAIMLGILLCFLTGCSEPLQTTKEITDQLELLGNPFLEKPLMARNVWDMKVFDERLYFGHGDAVANSGPIKLWRYDTNSKQFISDFTVDDESIHDFDVVGNQLLIAGYDPREAWDLGNFYRLEDGVWHKHRTIPWGIHAYQVIEFDGKLFVGLGTDHLHPSLLSSSDQGLTWLDATGKQFLDRAFNKLIVLNRQLYATGLLEAGTVKLENGVFVDANIPIERIAPGVTPDAPMIISKLEHFNNGVVYTVGTRQMYTTDPGEERYEPIAKAAFFSSNFQDTVPIPLPKDSFPTDILLKDAQVLILTHRKLEAGFENIVIESSDARSWKETLRFSSSSFARSFEFLNSQFYFGLGCYFTKQACAANGDVLRFTP